MSLRKALAHEALGWVKIDEVRQYLDSVGCGTIYKTAGEDRVPLYLAPPKREWVALTDEDIDSYALDIGVTANKAPPWLVKYARDIEAKLKEKNNA